MNDSEIVVRPRICKEFSNVLQHYEISDRARGEGQYSVVYKAVRKSDGKTVAVKVTKKKMRGIEHLVRKEMDGLKLIDSAHVVKFLDLLEDELTFYTVLEWVGGDDLSDRLAAKKRLSEQNTKTIVKTLLEALGCLHTKHLIHRDIKPSNVMFPSTATHCVKLIDFGSAESLPPNKDPLEKPVGTQKYMSPEMLKRRGYRQPNDLWALGVLTYLMLTGTEPFTGTGPALISAITSGDYFMPGSVSVQARSFISGCLQVDPSKRMTVEAALAHVWLKDHSVITSTRGGKTTPKLAFGTGPAQPPPIETSRALRRFRAAGFFFIAVMRLLRGPGSQPSSPENGRNPARSKKSPLLKGKRYTNGPTKTALCNSCNLPIRDSTRGVEAMEGYLHAECFKCGLCSGILEERYIEHEGHPCHKVCVEKLQDKGLPTCRGCGEKARGGVIWEEHTYHEKCFACTKCKAQIVNSAAEYGGEPYHGRCLEALKATPTSSFVKKKRRASQPEAPANGNKPLRVAGARPVLSRKSYPPTSEESSGHAEADNQPTSDSPVNHVVSDKRDRNVRVAGAPQVSLPPELGGKSQQQQQQGFQSAFCHECGQKVCKNKRR